MICCLAILAGFPTQPGSSLSQVNAGSCVQFVHQSKYEAKKLFIATQGW
jgi:hypothetical protein